MSSSISRKELIRKLKTLGYSGPFSGGKHQFMKKDQQKIRIPNPHGSGDIHVSLVKEILMQAGVNIDIWNKA